jgi:cellulose synthase/poly-beta-1,6-N-acetylglucosamine synthase-like glycosyltransferase
LVILAYNEENIIAEKIENSLQLDYPADQLNIFVVTDGSSDDTVNIVKKYKRVRLMHETRRRGKTAAINRTVPQLTAPVTVFTDANTLLNSEAIKSMVIPFNNKNVGCVAGEKRIILRDKDKAVVSGESFYWKYESYIKILESLFYSTMGAAGELFAIRTHLFELLPENTLLDDFELTLRIAQKGYRITYAPEAIAYEHGSKNITEELKRKVRIAAGCFQTMFRMGSLLNPLKNPILAFQYISHKVLRWMIVPFAFIAVFIVNVIIVIVPTSPNLYTYLLLLQTIFYLLALCGWLFRNRLLKHKIIFLPYYLVMMNGSIVRGLFRYLSGNQSVLWDKAKRLS